MLRVAHLLPNLITGGRERMVADLCAISVRNGIEPVVISYDPLSPGIRISLPGIRQFQIDRREPNFNLELHRLLMREQVNVLHAQGHISGALAAHSMKAIPSIITLHIALGQGWRWLPSISRGLHRAVLVTAVSDDLARRFRPWANKSISVVPPGIDLSLYTPTRRRNPSGPMTLGIAARLHPVKRHIDLFEALEMLKHCGLACRLHIAGQGPDEAKLRNAAAGLNVDFHGDVRDMAKWLSDIDAFVLPSDHEGTPLALIEAMASGLPCIATDVGGVRNLIGNAGILVPRRKPLAIARAIERLMIEPHLRSRLANCATTRAQYFSLEQQEAYFCEMYRKLAKPPMADVP